MRFHRQTTLHPSVAFYPCTALRRPTWKPDPLVALRPFRHRQDHAFRRSARRLIGDDEHFWGDDGIFNIEGGCYAKAIDLTPESEPEIFQALRFGSVLENVVFDERRSIDFPDTSITQNTVRLSHRLHPKR